MLQEVRSYLATRVDQDAEYFTPRYTKHQNSSSNCSTLLMKHVRSFSSDKTLKIHGFRDTLQSKFDAAGYAYKLSGYLIGWKNQQTVGMQKRIRSRLSSRTDVRSDKTSTLSTSLGNIS